MAVAAKRIRKTTKKSDFKDKFKTFILSANIFPLFLSFLVISILFVLFRMKGVELDYKINGIQKKIETVLIENKELKAQRARSLSIKSLRKMAKKHGLKQPKQKQMIVIP